jgi:RimJ/RimL family protein N-acetyltransferase
MRNLLQGKNVILTALKAGEEDILQQWFNNVQFMRHYDMVPAVPKGKGKIEELLNYYENSEERLLLAIRLVENDEIIGVAGFDEIVWSNGTAVLFVGIGDLSFRGKGFGFEALNLLIDYGFNELNFHKIQLNVIEYNIAAVKMYEKAGFIREGLYREYIYRDGRRYHLYLYGMLKSEWNRDLQQLD